jgi:stage IV sporulation protein A
MNKKEIISSIAKKGNGEIYLGVVGAVRTGKSTFIKKFIENLVIPNISDEYEKKMCLDELPQSASGKTIMTTEPKFVPTNSATIKIDEFTTKIKLVDCVGFVVPGATGFQDEAGNPRMVKSPWFDEAIPLTQAAEIGTEKVIKDHATIGIVITTDGSFGEIPRSSYIEAEEKVINELKDYGKPFIVILNSSKPDATETIDLARSLEEKYDTPVKAISVDNLNEIEIMEILKSAIDEFPVMDINVSIPEWVHVLNNNHPIKVEYLDKIKESVTNVDKIKDVSYITSHL